MATKTKAAWKVGEGFDLYKNEPTLSGRKGLTVGFLADVLSQFPREAEVVLNNYNAGDLRVLSEVVAQNFEWTKDAGKKLRNPFTGDGADSIGKKNGAINTVVLGYWDEGRMTVEQEE